MPFDRAEARAALLRRNPRCFFCRLPLTADTATLDHLIPRNLGGRNHKDNIQLACRSCNERKAHIPIEYLVFPRAVGGLLLRVWEVPFLESFAMSGKIVGFNYNALDGKARETARANAKEINALQRRTAEAAIETGRRLHEVHAAIGPTNFTAWLRAEFQWSQSISSKFMRIAAKFGDLDCASKFDYGALYLLAREKTDERAVTAAIAAARAGEKISQKRAHDLCRQFDTSPPPRPTPAPRAIPAASKPDIVADVKSSVRHLCTQFAEAAGKLSAAEAAELSEELLKLALELRMKATPAAPARKPAKPKKRAKAEAASV